MNIVRKHCIPTACISVLLSTVMGNAVGKEVTIPFDPVNFPVVPGPINNQYWPLTPIGASFSYQAKTEDECEFNKLIVTAETYYIAAVDVTTTVVRDQEWVAEVDDDGECDTSTAELTEDTRDYYAQDINGNIWYFGEDTWSWDDETEQCTDDGAWEAGAPIGDPEVDPAQAGIVMLANPESGDRYRQELLEDEAEDWGAVLRLNATASTDLGEFSDCLITKEWTPIEPGEIEHKYYCLTPETDGLGFGLVLIEELKGKTKTVELTDNFPAGLPGDNDANFPADALGCNGDQLRKKITSYRKKNRGW